MPRLALPLLFAYCLLSALPPLLVGWRSAPLEKGAVVAFVIWLLPLVLARPRLEALDPRPCWVGGGLCVVGSLLDLNLLRLLGFAVAAHGLSGGRLVGPKGAHLLAALLWMPLFSWLGHRLPLPLLLGLRLTGVTLASVLFWKGSSRS